MNTMTSRSQREVENLVRKFYGAERDLTSLVNTAGCSKGSHYLLECAAMYKELGNLLFLSLVSEGVDFAAKVWSVGPEEGTWMDFGLHVSTSREMDILHVVAQGHKEAVLHIKETLEVPGLPENIAMVLTKGVTQIKAISNGAHRISDQDENR